MNLAKELQKKIIDKDQVNEDAHDILAELASETRRWLGEKDDMAMTIKETRAQLEAVTDELGTVKSQSQKEITDIQAKLDSANTQSKPLFYFKKMWKYFTLFWEEHKNI